jgi:two-component system, LuxR family, response regulator FixJ
MSTTPTPLAPAPIVFVVDDEEPVGDSIAMLLRTVGLPAKVYRDPRRFLDDYRPEQPGCLLLDVRMPQLGGLEVQKELIRRRVTLPIIFITGHGDVPMAVEAMRAGALDFIQKPFNDDELIRRVQKALQQDAREREMLGRRDEIERRWAALTPREQDIARRIADGAANKVVAADLDISVRTVELHRARILEKMGVRAVAQLAQMLTQLPPPRTA